VRRALVVILATENGAESMPLRMIMGVQSPYSDCYWNHGGQPPLQGLRFLATDGQVTENGWLWPPIALPITINKGNDAAVHHSLA
jgi:hypothetical protein